MFNSWLFDNLNCTHLTMINRGQIAGVGVGIVNSRAKDVNLWGLMHTFDLKMYYYEQTLIFSSDRSIFSSDRSIPYNCCIKQLCLWTDRPWAHSPIGKALTGSNITTLFNTELTWPGGMYFLDLATTRFLAFRRFSNSCWALLPGISSFGGGVLQPEGSWRFNWF